MQALNAFRPNLNSIYPVNVNRKKQFRLSYITAADREHRNHEIVYGRDFIIRGTGLDMPEKWCEALNCQVSQFYEWLAWDKGIEAEVAAIGDRTKNIAGRNAYLMKYWTKRKIADAKRFAAAWQEQHPGKAVPKRLESYEISEYGRPPIEEDFELLMGE